MNNILDIQAAVQMALDAMNRVYDPKGMKEVFDEVLLVNFHGDTLRLNWYKSTRNEREIRASFLKDFKLIRDEIVEGDYLPGDFHFDNEAKGSVFDSFIYIGDRQYLVLNSVELSMNEVKEYGNWIAAQPYFVNLAAQFEGNPSE